MVKIKIVSKNKNFKSPFFQTEGASGIDLYADIDDDLMIKPLERVLIKTGIILEIPEGYEAQIRPRSGLAIKHGITVLNSPGTIDSDYRGEICVILINLSSEEFVVKPLSRIAQLVFAKVYKPEIQIVDDLSETKRGSGGFGSTGI
ncbi:MAG: dUTP diphosphatase [Spirochaetes bacterium]|nr:dUTP diphosphatase [Spirochaetota bacterium]